MKLAFLVYDSRSGSTLLSREIAASFPGVYVSPEVRFDSLFGRGPGWWREARDGRVLRRLESARVPEKLALPPAEVQRLSAEAGGVLPLIDALVARAAASQGLAMPDVAVIKSGMHLRASRRILADAPNARFVYVVRDPRAAIASKLETERPYVPGQKMAWAGAFAAAIQWRWYGRLAHSLGRRAPLRTVRYEALLENPDVVLEDLSGFLGTPRGTGGGRYGVPVAERAIHERVLTPGLDASRASAWRSSLSREDQAVIEMICSGEMRRWGYEPELQIGPFRAVWFLAKSFAVSSGRVAREAARRLARPR